MRGTVVKRLQREVTKGRTFGEPQYTQWNVLKHAIAPLRNAIRKAKRAYMGGKYV